MTLPIVSGSLKAELKDWLPTCPGTPLWQAGGVVPTLGLAAEDTLGTPAQNSASPW